MMLPRHAASSSRTEALMGNVFGHGIDAASVTRRDEQPGQTHRRRGVGRQSGASLAALLRSTHVIAPTAIVARVNDPDLMAVDENATLYTKCDTHSVCEIASNGAITILASDFQDARGIAIDPTRHLLYVVDRAAAGGTSYLRTYRLK